jgi:two-component system, NtrC family, nitrogen regulation sensor histidine kinase NtrY
MSTIPSQNNAAPSGTQPDGPQTDVPGDERQPLAWLFRATNNRKIAYFLALAALVSGVSTAITMTGANYDLQTVAYLLYVDVVLLLLLAGLVLAKFVSVWIKHKRQDTGASLHTQLVMLFSLIAVTPAVLVAIFAAVFLNIGLQSWFSDRVRSALDESSQVASAYLYEHQQNIRSEAFTIANDLNRQAAKLVASPVGFSRYLSAQAELRGIHEAIVTDRDGAVMARSPLSQALEFDLAPTWAFEKADAGEIVVLTSDQDDRVRAVMRLNRFVGMYLLIGRFVDSRVIDHIERVEQGIAQYKRIEEKRGGLQITFVALFVVVALLMLLAAAWVGMTVATNFANPISRLISAATRIGDGDLSVSVPEQTNLSELDTLMRAFNAMTYQLTSQKDGLLEANRELDERREFTETVLSGVSAGVIGLDEQARINLPNRSASDLLQLKLKTMMGQPLVDVVPEMAGLVNEAIKRPARQHEAELQIGRSGHTFTLLVRISAERLDSGEVIGYVVTFDDITDLQSAQRQAAWADVARRIAHEIKNPLTPIQLSAERLKRKYLKEVTSEPEIFENCTDTIIRQVNDIGRMVDEFSSFARMPEPQFLTENLESICAEAVFLESNRDGGTDVSFSGPDHRVEMMCDRQQVSRAISNVIKNAIESVALRQSTEDGTGHNGHVDVTLHEEEINDSTQITLCVEDNGVGLPNNERNRLTEPYVTTREKGTGLGLAIVKKIVEEHHGELVLEDSASGGARISMIFRPENG